MKVQVNDAPNSQKELVFELPYEVFEKASESELDKIIPTVKVPGFRPGKAPRDVVKKQYTHKIKANAIECVMNDAIREGLTTNGINPLSQAQVHDVEFEENKPIKFKANVDVFPTVKLEKFSGFDFERVEVEITDADMDDSIKMLQERNMKYEPVAGRDKVINGDIAVIDFEGKVDGVAFEGGSAKEFSLNIGSGQFIPGFEEGVIGMKKGAKKDIKVTFPEDYNAKDLAGKDAIFTVTLHEIKEKKMPELNEEFVKSIDPKSKDIKELTAKLKKGMEFDLNNKAKFDMFSSMLAKIIEENTFDVPYSFAKEQAERLAYNSMTQFYQMGLDPDKVGITFEMMVERHIGQAKDQVMQAIVINELAKKENILVNDADVDKFLGEHAEVQDKTLDELKKEITEQNMLETIKNDILGDKVRAFLEGLNTVKVKKMTKKEFDELANAQKAAASEKKETKGKKAVASKETKKEVNEESKETKKAPAKNEPAKKETKPKAPSKKDK